MLLLATLLHAHRADAIHRDTPFLVNVSAPSFGRGPNGQAAPPFQGAQCAKPSARAEPPFVAFQCKSDLLHNGSTGQQIYMFNLSKDVRKLGQVTNFPGGDSQNPSITAAGKLVAFDSNVDILKTGITARQVFIWTRQTGLYQQLTDGTADSTNPNLDAKGFAVAFQSSADLLHTGSTGTQVFLYDLTKVEPTCGPLVQFGCVGPTVLQQITHPPGQASSPFLSDNGNVLVFQSDAPLLGSANGSQQIFAFDRTLGVLQQLTNGNGDSTHPTTDRTGQLVAFQSTADLLGEGVTGSQIYVFDRGTNQLRRIGVPIGSSFSPSIGNSDHYVSFVSTGDLLATGSPGQHLYVWDLRLDELFQITADPGTVTNDPVTIGESFTFFASNEDMLRVGATGMQIYANDYFSRLPKLLLGKRLVEFIPGDSTGGGSQARITTANGVVSTPLTQFQLPLPHNNFQTVLPSLTMNIGDIDIYGAAPISMSPSQVQIPPIPVPGVGTICLKVTGPATGILDCRGGRSGGFTHVTKDHDLSNSGPGQITDPACSGQNDCTEAGQRIVGGIPVSSPACLGTLAWPHPGVCNGPQTNVHTGAFLPGQVDISIPVSVSVVADPGIDQNPCLPDSTDYKPLSGVPAVLELTTGSADGSILDANDVLGATLTTSDTGAPFDCQALLSRNYAGARLVGIVPVLDVPLSSGGNTDLLLDVSLLAGPGNLAYQRCTGPTCSVITACATNNDCGDSNVCNGKEICFDQRCLPGVPLDCETADACAGPSTCDPILGCQARVSVNCDDGSACTIDTCDPTAGCVHTPIPGCCRTDADCIDNNVCNGTEHCVAGTCVPGTPLQCGGDACNPQACDPQLGCHQIAGPARFTADGVRCEMAALMSALNAAPASSLGGPGQVRRLKKLLKVANHQLQIALRNPSIPSVYQISVKAALFAAFKRVKQFNAVLSNGLRQNKVDPTVEGPLSQMAVELMLRIQQFRNSAPQT